MGGELERLGEIVSKAKKESTVCFLVLSDDYCFGTDIYGCFVKVGDKRISCPTAEHALFANYLLKFGSREVFYPRNLQELQEAIELFKKLGSDNSLKTLKLF